MFTPPLSQQTKGWVMGVPGLGFKTHQTHPVSLSPGHHQWKLQMLLAEPNLWPAGEKLSF